MLGIGQSTEQRRNCCLALAAAFQATSLVHDLATSGEVQSDYVNTVIASLFKVDSKSVIDIYGSQIGLRYGLIQLQRFLNGADRPINQQVLRYLINLIYLEKRFQKAPSTQTALAEKIQLAQQQRQYFELTDPGLIHSLASAYSDILAPLQNRIMIVGNEIYLNSEDIIDKIRALLLAGFRAIILWRQLKGNRWQLIWQRSRYLESISTLLAD